MLDDTRIVEPEEMLESAERLKEIHPNLLKSFEGEVVDPYETTLKRLKLVGMELNWPLKERYAQLSTVI